MRETPTDEILRESINDAAIVSELRIEILAKTKETDAKNASVIAAVVAFVRIVKQKLEEKQQ